MEEALPSHISFDSGLIKLLINPTASTPSEILFVLIKGELNTFTRSVNVTLNITNYICAIQDGAYFDATYNRNIVELLNGNNLDFLLDNAATYTWPVTGVGCGKSFQIYESGTTN